MATVNYEKRLRDQARAEKKRLITIDYDGRAIKAGRVTIQLVENPARVKAIEEALRIICEDLSAEKKATR